MTTRTAGRVAVHRLIESLFTEVGVAPVVLFGTEQEGTLLPAGTLARPVEAVSGFALGRDAVYRFWLAWDGRHILRPLEPVDPAFFADDPEFAAARARWRRATGAAWPTDGAAVWQNSP